MKKLGVQVNLSTDKVIVHIKNQDIEIPCKRLGLATSRSTSSMASTVPDFWVSSLTRVRARDNSSQAASAPAAQERTKMTGASQVSARSPKLL